MKKILLCIALFGTFISQSQKSTIANETLFDKTFISKILPDNLPVDAHWNSKNELELTYYDKQTRSYKFFIFNPLTKTKQQVESFISTEEFSIDKNKLIYNNNTELVYTTDNTGNPKNTTASPNQKWLAYTKNNSLFAFNIETKSEKPILLSTSSTILNGYASWVYYEEILGRASRYKAFWWSPNSQYLAFMQFDESQVPVFPIYNSFGKHGSLLETRYPKAGDPNPKVRILFSNPTTGKITFADFNEGEDGYFAEPIWNPIKNTCFIIWENRLQNHYTLYEVDPETGTKQLIYDELQNTWVDIESGEDKIHFLNNKNKAILMSDISGWLSINMLDLTTHKITPITKDFTVTGILEIDEPNQTIYFKARKENTARTNLFKINFDGSQLTALTNQNFNHSSLEISPNKQFYYHLYQNVATPQVAEVCKINGDNIEELGKKNGLEFSNYNLCKSEIITIKSQDGLFNLPCYITYPTNYDPKNKYPLLISIYGGPNAGTVWDNFSWSPAKQLYANEGVIQVSLDHRASGHFGKKGLNYLYKRLGYWEIEDYSFMVEHLIKNYGADPTKICITGFSYGGYMTCLALTKAAHIFTHGMAGGSVVDWELYDSDYTERFMQRPQENPEGYKESSVLTYINNFKGKLQLVHGTDDDNVHLQNSLQFLSALQDSLKTNVEFMVYPSGKHGWGGNKNLHFKNIKNEFVYKHLIEKPMPAYLYNQ
ncbi:MAG: DPP IV N-terminal domain-containing protein [Alphaproteobacteria bacterium]|nr:DPP IV N-terminal domain-containing protein [Alphaproteobacteria bacterium]